MAYYGPFMFSNPLNAHMRFCIIPNQDRKLRHSSSSFLHLKRKNTTINLEYLNYLPLFIMAHAWSNTV